MNVNTFGPYPRFKRFNVLNKCIVFMLIGSGIRVGRYGVVRGRGVTPVCYVKKYRVSSRYRVIQ